MRRQAVVSPGELALLKLIQQKGPMKLRKVQKDPQFHGWDLDSIKAVITRLSGLGMLTLKGDTLSATHTASKVASRYQAEVVALRFQAQTK